MTNFAINDNGAGVDYVLGDYLGGLQKDGGKVHARFTRGMERRTFYLVVKAYGLRTRTRSLVQVAEGRNIYRDGRSR